MVGQISLVIKTRSRGPPIFHPCLLEDSTSDSINPRFIITIIITFTPRLGYRGIQRRWYRGQEEKEEHKSARLRSLKSATSSKSRQGCWVFGATGRSKGSQAEDLRAARSSLGGRRQPPGS